VAKFQDVGARAFGVDVDVERLGQAHADKGLRQLAASESEALPFASASFDGVLLHEVIEHVRDDRAAVQEAHRVTRPGGVVIIFAPNRLYPFETHGAFLRGRYVFGNIPLVGYLPDGWRKKVAPHVRAYRANELRALFAGLEGDIVAHTQVYPGYDKLGSRRKQLARVLRRVTYTLESTWLRTFGLSHFIVWRRGQEATLRSETPR
jgi:SAM-dependent methyltransferase